MFEAALAGVFGLLIGSFLNVCIHRWPLDESVIRPRSHCPSCGAAIAWFDNVPVLSFVALGGRCRHCRSAISGRYPAVELLTGALFGWFVYRHGLSLEALRWCVFGAVLVALAFVDAETRILPDELTLGGAVFGLAMAYVNPLPGFEGSGERLWSLGNALAGAAIPSGALWLGGVLFERIRHKEGLGLGDVKMTAMLGAFLGLEGALLALAIGSTLGSVLGLIYIGATKKEAGSYELPLGTFLAVGALVYAFFGQQFLRWYGALR